MPRTDPPYVGAEGELLWAFLDYGRDTLVLKTDGLDAVQLDTRLSPSTMTLGGMLSHMAFVEDWWFSVRLHGNDPEPPFAGVDWESDWDWDWHTAVDRAAASGWPAWPSTRSRRRRPGRASRSRALDRAPHGRGVRPPHRARRPDPGVGRRLRG